MGCHTFAGRQASSPATSRAPLIPLLLVYLSASAPALAIPAFSAPAPVSTSAVNATFVVASDIDGDGDIDVVVSEYGINAVAWYENSGAATPVWTKHPVDSAALGPVTVA